MVIIVDDDPRGRQLLKRLQRSAGIPVSNIQFSPSDMRMPGIDGWELQRKIGVRSYRLSSSPLTVTKPLQGKLCHAEPLLCFTSPSMGKNLFAQ